MYRQIKIYEGLVSNVLKGDSILLASHLWEVLEVTEVPNSNNISLRLMDDLGLIQVEVFDKFKVIN